MISNFLQDETSKKQITYCDTYFVLSSFREFLEDSIYPTLYVNNDAYLFMGSTDINLESKDIISVPSDLIIRTRDFQDLSVDEIEIFTNSQKNLENLVNQEGFSPQDHLATQKSITFQNSKIFQKTKFSNQVLYFNLFHFQKIIYTPFYDPQITIQATDDIRYLERRLGNYVGNLLENQSLYK